MLVSLRLHRAIPQIRVAAPSAKFSIMEAKWGLIPDMGGPATRAQRKVCDF